MPHHSRRLIWPAAIAVVAALAYVEWETVIRAFGGGRWLMELDAGRLAVGTVSWLAAAWLASRIIDRALSRAAQRRGTRSPRLLAEIITAALFVAAAVASIALVFNRPITGLVATSGVLVAIIGFALRNIIADIFSGIALNMEMPYHIGDWVQTEDGIVGRVTEINWRATRLVTREQTLVVVPNGRIASGRLVNFSAPDPIYRAQVPVTLEYDLPVERARRLLLTAVKGVPLVLAKPAPDVRIESYGDRGLRYLVRYWVADYSSDVECRDTVAAAIHHHLRLAGIGIPHGRQDITVMRARDAQRPRFDRTAVLGRVPLLDPLAERDLARLAESGKIVRLPAGAELVREGEPGASLFVLVEGLLRVCRGPENTLLDTLRPGDVVGERSLLTGAPRSATVSAVTDVTLFEIASEHLRPILQRTPELAEGLGIVLAERERHNKEMIERFGKTSNTVVPADAPQSLVDKIRVFFGIAN